jgi:hypothetical protein
MRSGWPNLSWNNKGKNDTGVDLFPGMRFSSYSLPFKRQRSQDHRNAIPLHLIGGISAGFGLRKCRALVLGTRILSTLSHSSLPSPERDGGFGWPEEAEKPRPEKRFVQGPWNDPCIFPFSKVSD